MDPKIYLEMANTEGIHWWFVARRKILEKVIKGLKLPTDAEIFEAGCGTGGNLAMLARHGQLYAMELDEVARKFASDRNLAKIKPGRLPEDIPFVGKDFDLIVLLDVLEHLDEDYASLEALYHRLKPGGYLLITVPAYSWLWGEHDLQHHHKRRYVKKSLSRLVKSANYHIRYVSYFNTILFPLIAGVRLFQRFLGRKNEIKLNVPSPSINQFLTWLFASECHLINSVSLPFGVSLLLLAQKSRS